MLGVSSLRLFGITGGALVLVGALGALVACATPSADDGAEGTAAAVTAKPFDKNNAIDDKSMRDATTISAGDVQKLLEKTPWGTASVLASYTEGGKTAAEIITDTAIAHKLNPLELVVRAQMEQGLISKTTAPAATIAKAFGCGCPDGSTCSAKYQGFAAQAECAAGTMDRAISAAQTSAGTVSGWARSKTKETQDSVAITPGNASTAALYTYTPWVGEAGGGKAGVGGVSLHYQVWDRFAQWTSYGAYANTVLEGTGSDAGAATDPDASTAEDAATADASTDPGDDGADAGTKAAPSDPDAGTGTSSGPPSDGSEDGTIVGEGSAPPSSNAPPPSSTKSVPTKPSELEQASDDDLTSKKKAAAGCSTTGTTNAGSGLLIAGAVALSALISRRRR